MDCVGVVILLVWTVCWCCHSAGVDYVLVLSFCWSGLCVGVVILPVWTVCWCCHSAGVDCVLVLSFYRCGLCVGVVILPVLTDCFRVVTDLAGADCVSFR